MCWCVYVSLLCLCVSVCNVLVCLSVCCVSLCLSLRACNGSLTKLPCFPLCSLCKLPLAQCAVASQLALFLFVPCLERVGGEWTIVSWRGGVAVQTYVHAVPVPVLVPVPVPVLVLVFVLVLYLAGPVCVHLGGLVLVLLRLEDVLSVPVCVCAATRDTRQHDDDGEIDMCLVFLGRLVALRRAGLGAYIHTVLTHPRH